MLATYWNRWIAASRGTTPARLPANWAHAPPEAKFAAAYAAAAHGDVQQALNDYRELQGPARRRLRHDAMFNSGNVYLQQALEAQTRTDQSAALTLAELAKASYRELLREDSDDWDARYNLEKTLRIAPDPEAEEEAFGTPPSHLQKAPTGPGTTLGLP